MGQLVNDIKNAYINAGTSQAQRSLAALDPASVKIDSRTMQDYLLFTNNLARQIKYYNANNQLAGDWTAFWEADNSFILAAIEKTNPLPHKDAFEIQLQNTSTASDIQELIHLILKVLHQIAQWNNSVQATSPLKNEITRLIEANLSGLPNRLMSYEKGALSKQAETFNYPEIDESLYQFASKNTSNNSWRFSGFDEINPDTSLFTPVFELDEETGDFKIPDLNEPELWITTAKDRLENLF
ncbi:MAG: hypothetical protein AAGG68_26025, partial [Bacteroidota bacterium]